MCHVNGADPFSSYFKISDRKTWVRSISTFHLIWHNARIKVTGVFNNGFLGTERTRLKSLEVLSHNFLSFSGDLKSVLGRGVSAGVPA
jgi:hypothetical protein